MLRDAMDQTPLATHGIRLQWMMMASLGDMCKLAALVKQRYGVDWFSIGALPLREPVGL